MKKLTMAVVGAGRLGGFHAQKLAAMEDVCLAAVVDPSAANRNCVAQQCQVQALADHRGLFGWVDAVVIAAPTALHHELGLEFLNRGIHVLMEKPLCSTAAQAEELVAAARRNAAVLQVGHVERFNPAFVAAVPYVRQPKYIEAVRAGNFTFRSTDVGVVLDLMIHDIDLVLALNRCPVTRVDAMGLSVLGGHEDVANARLEFENGCIATLSACRVSYEAVRRMQVWTLRGLATIDFAARSTTLVHPSETLLARQFDVHSLTAEEVEHYQKHLMEEHLPRQEHSFAAVDALQLELADFVEAIGTPRAPRVSGQQGCDAVVLAEQILEQIQEHAWDGASDGRSGPHGLPRRTVIPAPHFHLSAKAAEQRRAG